MNPVSRISPVSDAEAARLVSADAFADLAGQIMSATAPQAARPRRAPSRRRRLLIGMPLAAGLATAVLIATSIGRPGDKVGPLSVGPARAQAQALVFKKDRITNVRFHRRSVLPGFGDDVRRIAVIGRKLQCKGSATVACAMVCAISFE